MISLIRMMSMMKKKKNMMTMIVSMMMMMSMMRKAMELNKICQHYGHTNTHYQTLYTMLRTDR